MKLELNEKEASFLKEILNASILEMYDEKVSPKSSYLFNEDLEDKIHDCGFLFDKINQMLKNQPLMHLCEKRGNDD